MLCTISMSLNQLSSPRQKFLIEVPDELFMRHMMMYGAFKPDQLTDNEFLSCTVMGLRDSARFEGTIQRKGKK